MTPLQQPSAIALEGTGEIPHGLLNMARCFKLSGGRALKCPYLWARKARCVRLLVKYTIAVVRSLKWLSINIVMKFIGRCEKMEYKIRCCIYCGEGFEAHDGNFIVLMNVLTPIMMI